MSIAKGTLVSWTNAFTGVKGTGITLSGEDDGHVIVAVNNFGNETPSGKVATKDDEDHSGFHPLVWFASADLTDVVAEAKAKADALAEAQAKAAKAAAEAEAGRMATMQNDLAAATARHDTIMATALQASLDAAKKQQADRAKGEAAKAASAKAVAAEEKAAKAK